MKPISYLSAIYQNRPNRPNRIARREIRFPITPYIGDLRNTLSSIIIYNYIYI